MSILVSDRLLTDQTDQTDHAQTHERLNDPTIL